MSLIIKIIKPILAKYIKHKATKNLPNYNQSIISEHLTEKVEIIRDKWAVPHVYAQNENDLYFAQGYIHAQDRLWQMELTRRVVAGRLSEVIGKDTLAVDKIVRRFGLHKLALADKKKYKKQGEIYTFLEKYTAGVNHYIKECKNLPVEFKLLKHQPEPWTIEDSLGISRLVAFQMAQGWLHEIDRLTLSQKYGIEKAAELLPQYPAQNPIALKYGIETFERKGSLFEAFKGPYLQPLGGSNNWVVAPEKSTTNTAILCNDPHLLINTPNIWFENHLVAPTSENTGVSIPGLPFVLIGHNAKIAWGATLSYADIQDTYVEKFTSKNKTQYHFGERILKASVREEIIKIKKEKIPHIEKVIETLHGPVIFSLDDTTALTLKSKGLGDSDTNLGFYRLNKAQNWNDFVAACEILTYPSLNLVYADVEQNIGYYMTGEVPVRARTKDFLPANGFDAKQEWTGSVPFAEMPHVFNPKQGYFYTCNHKIVEDDFPHDLGNIWMNGYRAQTLEKYLQSKDKFSLEDFKKWQLDFHCPPGKEFAIFFEKWLSNYAESLPQAQFDMLQLLVDWDGHLDSDSIGGTVYQVIKQQLLELLLEDKRPLQGSVSNKEIPLFSHSEFFGQDTTILLQLLSNPASVWWGGQQEEKLATVINNTYTYLSEKLGTSFSNWKWGSLHQIVSTHSLGAKPPLGDIFNVGNVPIGGDTDTLCQMAFIPTEEYSGAMVGASYRQIIDMGDLAAAQCITPVGQSGNVVSLHYSDQFESWKNGDYKPMLWDRKEIEAAAAYRMEITTKP